MSRGSGRSASQVTLSPGMTVPSGAVMAGVGDASPVLWDEVGAGSGVAVAAPDCVGMAAPVLTCSLVSVVVGAAW